MPMRAARLYTDRGREGTARRNAIHKVALPDPGPYWSQRSRCHPVKCRALRHARLGARPVSVPRWSSRRMARDSAKKVPNRAAYATNKLIAIIARLAMVVPSFPPAATPQVPGYRSRRCSMTRRDLDARRSRLVRQVCPHLGIGPARIYPTHPVIHLVRVIPTYGMYVTICPSKNGYKPNGSKYSGGLYSKTHPNRWYLRRGHGTAADVPADR